MRRSVAALWLACAWVGCASQMQPPAAGADPCVTYCTFAFQNCVTMPVLYTGWSDCAAQCASFDAGGEAGDTSGNTLQCRLTYVLVADQNPQAFCDNAGPRGGTDCI